MHYIGVVDGLESLVASMSTSVEEENVVNNALAEEENVGMDLD